MEKVRVCNLRTVRFEALKHGRDFIESTLLAVFPYNLNSDEMDSNYCMMLQFCAHIHRKQRQD